MELQIRDLLNILITDIKGRILIIVMRLSLHTLCFLVQHGLFFASVMPVHPFKKEFFTFHLSFPMACQIHLVFSKLPRSH